MIECALTAEQQALPHADSRALLFMFTASAPPFSSTAARGQQAAGASAAQPASSLDVCCLEGCGLGWRVRPPLQRRSPWSVSAQRMRLCIEAMGGAKVEHVYTLLEHHELAPSTSFEVNIGDLHAGDAVHVVALVWVPPVEEPVPLSDAVRFSLQYIDAVKIETKSCELCATLARPPVRAHHRTTRARTWVPAPRRAPLDASLPHPSPPSFLCLAPPPFGTPLPSRPPTVCSPFRRGLYAIDAIGRVATQIGASSPLSAPCGPPVSLDRERNRVVVAEALHRAAVAANSGSLEAACVLLSEVCDALRGARAAARAGGRGAGEMLQASGGDGPVGGVSV